MIRRVLRVNLQHRLLLPTVVPYIQRHPSRQRFFAEAPKTEESAEREAIKKDPTVDPKEAENMWIRDIEDKKVTKSTRSEMFKIIWPHFKNKKNMGLFAVAIGSMILSKGLSIGAPYMLKIAVNSLPLANALSTVCGAIIGYGFCRVTSSILNEMRGNLVMNMNMNVIRSLSNKLFEHIHSLDLSFHRSGTRNTLYATSRAVRNVETGLRFILSHLTPTLIEFVMLGGLLSFYCGPKYAIDIFITIGAYTWFTKWYSTRRIDLIRRRKEVEKRQEAFLNETLMNFDSVKYFMNEKREQQKYDNYVIKYGQSWQDVQKTLGRLNMGQTAIFTTGLVVNLIFSALDCFAGVMTPGDFVMLQALFLQVATPLNMLGTMFKEIDDSLVHFEEIKKVLNTQPKVVEKKDAKDYFYKGGKIEFKNVSFTFKPSKVPPVYLLKDLSMTVEPHKHTALVGPSGFGKTTIFNLIYRLLDPQEGEVLIDGQNVKDLKLDSMRKYITIIPQNGTLFNETILFNLLYGRPNATFQEVVDVAKKCQLHDEIMVKRKKPKKYETQVGELGLKLSGGERQRILIARGLLKKAEIFLFDEATSNLDSYNEKRIVEEIDKMLKGKTVILCAHRLTSIADADKIIVMGSGRVIEEGDHDKLITKPGSCYARYWRDFMGRAEESCS